MVSTQFFLFSFRYIVVDVICCFIETHFIEMSDIISKKRKKMASLQKKGGWVGAEQCLGMRRKYIKINHIIVGLKMNKTKVRSETKIT